MLGAVLLKRDTLKIADDVVSRVPVNVMDLIFVRYGAIVELPNIPVKPMTRAGEIPAVGRVRRLRIAVVAIPVEDNSLHNDAVFRFESHDDCSLC